MGVGSVLQGQPELRNLGSFVAVAEELHFTRAAQRQHLSQQTLSSQIRQLETALGVELFRRTTRKVELTEAGRTLLAHAVPLLAAAARAWDDVARSAVREQEQHLSLSYAPTVRREMLPMLLREFARRRPDVKVSSCEVWWGDAPMLGDGIIEVTITRSTPTEEDDVLSVPIFHTPLGVMIGRDHPLAQRESVSLPDLKTEALKIWPRPYSPRFYDTILSAMREGGFTGPVEELVIFGSKLLQEDPAACAAIAECRAIGFGFAEQYPMLEPELVWRVVEPTIRIPMHLCWRRDASEPVRAFIEVTLDVAQDRGWLGEDRREEAERLLAA
jgi:DNA-binding transcriptional LysR family regulator